MQENRQRLKSTVVFCRSLSNFSVKSKEIHSEWKKGKISVKKEKGTFRASIENTGGGKKNTIIIISLLQ